MDVCKGDEEERRQREREREDRERERERQTERERDREIVVRREVNNVEQKVKEVVTYVRLKLEKNNEPRIRRTK